MCPRLRSESIIWNRSAVYNAGALAHMSANKNPTTLPPLKAEHDSKIAGRNAVRGDVGNLFSSSERKSFESFQADKKSEAKIQEVRDLQGFSRCLL
jgi:hypothetical protein